MNSNQISFSNLGENPFLNLLKDSSNSHSLANKNLPEPIANLIKVGEINGVNRHYIYFDKASSCFCLVSPRRTSTNLPLIERMPNDFGTAISAAYKALFDYGLLGDYNS